MSSHPAESAKTIAATQTACGQHDEDRQTAKRASLNGRCRWAPHDVGCRDEPSEYGAK